VSIPSEKKLLGDPRRKWENNIKLDLKKAGEIYIDSSDSEHM
jgi:hypothetical protein